VSTVIGEEPGKQDFKSLKILHSALPNQTELILQSTIFLGWAWWYTAVFPTLRMLRQYLWRQMEVPWSHKRKNSRTNRGVRGRQKIFLGSKQVKSEIS
jgi:hypothetical protein